MANVGHASLSGSDLHETKGAGSASADTVHKANGSGVTSWSKITSANIDASSVFRANTGSICVTFPDISTLGSLYVPIPVNCTITAIYGALQGAIITADTVLTFRNHAGNSMGTMTVAFTGSAAGDVDTLAPASNNTFTAGQRMKIDSDGGSANTVNEVLVIEYTQTT